MDRDQRQDPHSRESAGEGPRALPYLEAAIPVGVAGAVAVAGFVLLVDVLAGHPLGTPNALGATLLRGSAFDPTAPVQPGLVFSYTLLHLATFVAVACAAVSAEFTLSRAGVPLPLQLIGGILGLATSLQAIFLSLTLLLGISWIGSLGFERVFVVNVVAAFSMAIVTYLRGEGRRELGVLRERVPVRIGRS